MKTNGYRKIMKMTVSDLLHLLADISETVGSEESGINESKHKGRSKRSCLIDKERREDVKALIKRVSDEFWSKDFGRYEVEGTTMSVNIISAFIGYCLVELAVMPEEYNATDFLKLLNEAPMNGIVTITQLKCNAKIVDSKMAQKNFSYMGTADSIMHFIKNDSYFKADENGQIINVGSENENV